MYRYAGRAQASALLCRQWMACATVITTAFLLLAMDTIHYWILIVRLRVLMLDRAAVWRSLVSIRRHPTTYY